MRLTGGQALVQSLEAQGVDVVFGLPGVQLDWAFDALYLERDATTVYHTRHEQAVSYMADGYARTTDRVGVCLTVPGPGLLNAMAGLATAYACSSPVLCITGQIPTRHIGKGRGLLHEIKDQLQAVRSVTKWAAAASAPKISRRSFARRSGSCGPAARARWRSRSHRTCSRRRRMSRPWPAWKLRGRKVIPKSSNGPLRCSGAPSGRASSSAAGFCDRARRSRFCTSDRKR